MVHRFSFINRQFLLDPCLSAEKCAFVIEKWFSTCSARKLWMGWVRGINWDGIGSALGHGFLNRVEDFAPSAGWDAARPGTLSVPGTAAARATTFLKINQSQTRQAETAPYETVGSISAKRGASQWNPSNRPKLKSSSYKRLFFQLLKII